MKKHRALFINPGPTPPNPNPALDRIAQLSPQIEGVVLQSTWGELDESGALRKRYDRDGIVYYVIKSAFIRNPFKLIIDITFFVYRGVFQHYFVEKFDVVVSYGMTRTGLSALIVSRLIGRPLVVEVPGRPTDAYLADSDNPSVGDKLKNFIVVSWCKIIFRAAETIRVFYKDQLAEFSGLDKEKIVSFPDYVPLESLKGQKEEEKYILFLGFPWALKGVATIIKAFNRISIQIPDFRLKIVGHCPDRTPYEELASGNVQIDFMPGVRYEEAIDLIQRSSFVVLASKTEGMPRVIVEAMAAKKSFISTKVGGVPEYTTDGQEGFHVEVGDDEELSRKMLLLAQQSDLRLQMGERGFAKAKSLWSEGAHTQNFVEMINDTVKRCGQ